MLKISQRASQIQASPLRKLANVAQERKKKGIKVYHLNIGQPDVPTPQEFYQRIHVFKDNPVEYTMSQGIEELIDAWRTYYSTFGISLEREETIITTGGSEALIFAFCAIADPGDEIIAFEPFYTNYNTFARLGGVAIKPVTLSLDTGFHLPPDEEIEAAITPRTKAMVVCNPSNPTGTVLTEDELQRLVRIAIKHNLFIIADEVYRDFTFEYPTRSFLTFPEAKEHVIVVDSASKRFSACGARIGVLFSHNADVMAAALKFAMSRLSVSTIDQVGMVPVLAHANDIVPPVVEEYRKRRDVVYEHLSAMEGVKVHKPEGALYSICELPVDSSEKFAQWMISEFEQDGETVLVSPAPGFYATPGKGEKEIRIAYVLEVPQLHRAMALIEAALKRYNHLSL